MFLFFMKTCSIEWAAGLFEGEGCIFLSKDKRHKRLALTMTDYDVVRKFAEVVSLPNNVSLSQTNSLNKDGSPRKPAWACRTGRRADIVRILSMLLPYFGDRRAYKALNVLDHLELS